MEKILILLMALCAVGCTDVEDAERTAQHIRAIEAQTAASEQQNALYSEEAARLLEEQALQVPGIDPDQGSLQDDEGSGAMAAAKNLLEANALKVPSTDPDQGILDKK